MTPLLRRALTPVFGVLLVSCGDESTGDESTAAGTTTEAAAEPTGTLERFAGTWHVRARNEVGDTLPSHDITATGDTAGWTLTFPNREPIPMRILNASGDLVVAETAPYESVIRPGVRVTVLYFTRLHGDSVSGRFIAMYDVDGANAILRGLTDGTRRP
jgi:hypothetical protein